MRLIAAIATAVIASASPPRVRAEAILLRVAYADQELSPYAMGSEQTHPDPPGIFVEILDRAAKELGVEIEYKRMPTQRGQRLLRHGEIDCYFSLSYQPERESIGVFPKRDGKIDPGRRLGTLSYHLYKRSGTPPSFDGKSLVGNSKPVAAETGYSIVATLDAMGLSVDEDRTVELNLRKLARGKVDVYAGQDVSVDRAIATGKYGAIEKIPTPVASKDYYLLFSADFYLRNRDLAERLWDRIGKLRDAMTASLAPKYHGLEGR